MFLGGSGSIVACSSSCPVQSADFCLVRTDQSLTVEFLRPKHPPPGICTFPFISLGLTACICSLAVYHFTFVPE
jgi:hypothetical protein